MAKLRTRRENSSLSVGPLGAGGEGIEASSRSDKSLDYARVHDGGHLKKRDKRYLVVKEHDGALPGCANDGMIVLQGGRRDGYMKGYVVMRGGDLELISWQREKLTELTKLAELTGGVIDLG
jgi:hypothetical protein